MKNKSTLYNFILDRSGSMSGMETVEKKSLIDYKIG